MNKLEALHDAWQKSSGQIINIRAAERILYELGNMGVTPEDIQCVVGYLIRCNKKSDAKYRIMFHKVLEPEFFHSVLGEARAQERNQKHPPTPREKFQQQYEQVITQEPVREAAVPFSEILKRIREPHGN